MLIKLRKSQSVTEYTIFIAAVVAGLIGLQTYFQRGIKGNIKQRSDAVGGQFTTTEGYTVETQSQTLRSTEGGYIENGDYWSRSKILSSAGGSGETDIESTWVSALKTAEVTKLGYKGHEISKTDYVDQIAKGKGVVGDHATFDSGELGKNTPWKDAGIE